MVYLISRVSADSSAIKKRAKLYYTTPISLQRNVNNNAIPKAQTTIKSAGGDSNDYQAAAAGNPNASSTSPFKFEYGFEEVKDLSAIQPFTGDVLLEGRFGQSIRLGYTP